MSRATVSTGIAQLDERLGGGFPLDRSVLVCGGTGTGKTIFAVQFLMDGIVRGEAGVLVTADEKPQHLAEDARCFGWDLVGASQRHLLALLDASPYFTATRGKAPMEAVHVASDLTQQVRRVQARRLVIDSITSLVPPDAPRADVQSFLRSLIRSLEDNLGCTVLLTAHTPRAGIDDEPVVQLAQVMVSGLVELKRDEQGRSLVVHKMRGTCVESIDLPLDIVSGDGVVLRGLRYAARAVRRSTATVRSSGTGPADMARSTSD
jgi:circadian clock protein KaiC